MPLFNGSRRVLVLFVSQSGSFSFRIGGILVSRFVSKPDVLVSKPGKSISESQYARPSDGLLRSL